MTTSDYPDHNQNGIPDAFENRPSIAEILNDEAGGDSPAWQPDTSAVQLGQTIIIEVEVAARPPRKGEMYISGANYINQLPFDLSSDHLIVRRVISGDKAALERANCKPERE